MFLGGIALFLSLATASASLPIQMGATWDREEIKEVSDGRIQNFALSVGRIEVIIKQSAVGKETEIGTAFVVGRRNKELILATNYHVMPKKSKCTVHFTTLGRSASCETFLGSWKNLELALFTVKAKKLEKLPILELDDSPLTKNLKLFTMGYGYYQNSTSKLTVDRSEYCQTFSGDIRFIAANDDFGAFSFPHGCEISTSDSGSPIFDEETGKVVAIQWAASTREKDNVIDEVTLDLLLGSPAPISWNSLNYAVPAKFITEKLNLVN